jgi:hypothetical protein
LTENNHAQRGGGSRLFVHFFVRVFPRSVGKHPFLLPLRANLERKGVRKMPKNPVIFQLTRLDVVECIRELDLPYIVNVEKVVTDEFLEEVKKGIEFGLECWSEVMKVAVTTALEKHTWDQPLLVPAKS